MTSILIIYSKIDFHYILMSRSHTNPTLQSQMLYTEYLFECFYLF